MNQLVLSVVGMVLVASLLHHALMRGMNGTLLRVGLVVIGLMAGVALDVPKLLLPLTGGG